MRCCLNQESRVLRTLASCESTLRRLMQNLTRPWRYKKLFKLFNRFWYKSAYTKNGIRRKVRHRLILKSDQSMGEALTVAAMVQTADGLFLKHRLCLAYPWA